MDGCLKLLNFQPRYSDSEAAYFEEASIFLSEDRKEGWENWLEEAGICTKDKFATEAEKGDGDDANLHSTREVDAVDKRLAAHGVEQAICFHGIVLAASNMAREVAVSSLLQSALLWPHLKPHVYVCRCGRNTLPRVTS